MKRRTLEKLNVQLGYLTNKQINNMADNGHLAATHNKSM